MVPRSDVAYLVGSEARPTLLSACSEGEKRPSDLAANCEVSRSTVHRVLNGFLDRGWIQMEDGCYSTTPFGETVLDRYGRLLDAVERANEFGQWYRDIDLIDEEFPIQAICNEEIVTATSANPTAPLDFVSTVVRPTDESSVRICTPARARFLELAVERITDTGGTLDIVVPSEVLSECDQRFDDISSLPRITVHPTDSTIPCGIVVLESAVLILGFDEANRVISALKTSASDARDWAMDVFGSVGPQGITATG